MRKEEINNLFFFFFFTVIVCTFLDSIFYLNPFLRGPCCLKKYLNGHFCTRLGACICLQIVTKASLLFPEHDVQNMFLITYTQRRASLLHLFKKERIIGGKHASIFSPLCSKSLKIRPAVGCSAGPGDHTSLF